MKSLRILIPILICTLIFTSCSNDDDAAPIPEIIVLSDAKQITSFQFLLSENPIAINVIAIINEDTKTIEAIVPSGTDISALLPTIQIPTDATLNLINAQDFSLPTTYIVTAEDGTTASYEVIVEVALTQKEVLLALSNANSGNTLEWELETETSDINTWRGVNTNEAGDIITLYLNTSGLTTIPSEIWQLTELTDLDLSENNITTIPAEIKLLENLTYLSLEENSLTTIPSEIWELINLTTLNLEDNSISEISTEIGQLIDLERLNLSHNSLTFMPSQVWNLLELTSLNISNNPFSVFPEEVWGLTNLTSLNIGSLGLESIPSEIEQLDKLTYISLTNNELITLPPEIGFLTELTGLHLNNNNLTSIPTEVGLLTNLNHLRFEGNPLPSGIPQTVCELETIGDTSIDVVPGINCIPE